MIIRYEIEVDEAMLNYLPLTARLSRIAIHALAPKFGGSILTFNHETESYISADSKVIALVPVGKFSMNPWIKVEVADFKEQVDYYVAVIVDSVTRTVECKGWVTREDLTRNEPQKCGEGDRYPLNYIAKNLRNMSSFPLLSTPTAVSTPTTESSTSGSTPTIIYAEPLPDKLKIEDLVKPRNKEEGIAPGSIVKIKGIDGPTLIVARPMTAGSGKTNLYECVYYTGNELKTSILPSVALVEVK